MVDSTVQRFAGRVALITGSGGGIGREHARLFARHGAKVVVNDVGFRAGADAEAVAKEINSDGGVAVANTTSATWDSADRLVAEAIQAFGEVDILINNATFTRFDDLWNYPEENWDATLHDVDLYPPRKISPLVAWLCSDAAGEVNGCAFETHGDTVSLLSEPEPLRSMHREGGWDLDALDALAPSYLEPALTNDFRLDDHPELKKSVP